MKICTIVKDKTFGRSTAANTDINIHSDKFDEKIVNFDILKIRVLVVNHLKQET